MAGKGNVRSYKRPLQLNIGVILFVIIFIYLVVAVVAYSTSKHIVGYEVRNGELEISNVYTGIALRDETIVLNNSSGYISYFIQEASRIGVDDIVCSSSNTDLYSDLLYQSDENTTSISEEESEKLKDKLENYVYDMEEDSFQSVYKLKHELDILVSKYRNNALKNDLLVMNSQDSSGVSFQKSLNTGLVIYSIDGYEEITPEMISQNDFDPEKYERDDLLSGDFLEAGSPCYKVITSDLWSIVISVDDARYNELVEDDYVKIQFAEDQTESWAQIHHINGIDGKFIELKFNNSMISHATERFIDIEILVDEDSGLKIPNTAIVDNMFFLIPKEFVFSDGDMEQGPFYLLVKAYTEDGVESTERLDISIYAETETSYYIDMNYLNYGSVLLMENSQSTFEVNQTGTLKGVYNINKGYANFTQITILYQNDEYSIVQSNSKYGLREFDYIILDSDSVEEDDLLYH